MTYISPDGVVNTVYEIMGTSLSRDYEVRVREKGFFVKKCQIILRHRETGQEFFWTDWADNGDYYDMSQYAALYRRQRDGLKRRLSIAIELFEIQLERDMLTVTTETYTID